MQPAVGADYVQPRPQPEMEGVAEHDLRADVDQLIRRHGLDRAISADRHEHRRLDGTVGQVQATAARGAVGGEEVEFHCRRRRVVRVKS